MNHAFIVKLSYAF